MNYNVKRKNVRRTFSPGCGNADGPETGLFQGNGDIFSSLWNKPDELTWSVSKTDIWDRRYYGDAKRVVTLEEVRRLAFNGDPEKVLTNNTPGFPGSAHLLYRAYDFPCPKPAGQVIFRSSELRGAKNYKAELDMVNGILTVSARKDEARCLINTFISPVHSVMVFQTQYRNLNQPLCFELYRHRDTLVRGETVMTTSGSYPPDFVYDYDQDSGNGPLENPEVGNDGAFFWVRQRFPAEATFPGGFEYVMMAVIPGIGYEVTKRENVRGAGAKIPLKKFSTEEWKSAPGSWKEKRKALEMVNAAPGWLVSAELKNADALFFTAYVAVKTSRDAENPFAAARQELNSAINLGEKGLASERRKWWQGFWSRSSVRIADRKFSRKWYGNLYYLALSRRSGKVPLSNATGPIFADATPWHGDYHFNEMWLHPFIIANHTTELIPWMEMLEEMLPMTQANARDVYRCRGCCFPLVHYPIKSKRVVYTNQIWELGIDITGMVLQVFWQYYLYTGDSRFLCERAYPMLREGARFYADYVKKETDGCYHVVPTVSQENWGITRNFGRNRDSVGSLTMVRYILHACLMAAEFLGLDEKEREKWREITKNLAPYPTYPTGEGPIFVDVRNAPPHPRLIQFADLAMVLWGEEINLDANAELLEIARRTYRLINPGNRKIQMTIRPHYLAAIERRLGLPRTSSFFEVEDLLMSITGRMHLFPGIPSDKKAEFERLLAVGGFEVSASRKNGKVNFFRIKSLAGQECRFKNPWHPVRPVVTDISNRREVSAEIKNDTVFFATVPDVLYGINLDG